MGDEKLTAIRTGSPFVAPLAATDLLYAVQDVATTPDERGMTADELRREISRHRPVTVTQSATPAINVDNGDIFNITGLAQAITSLTTNLTGTPFANQMIMINITDDGTARAIARGASFVSTSGVTMATTTVLGKRLCEIYQWNGAAWECVGSVSSL